MPTYDYVCKFCEHAFEHFQSVHDKRLLTCPECKRRGLERLIGSGAGVLFKGSGFYETDYKRAGRPAEDGGSEPGKSDASKSDKPSSDKSKSDAPQSDKPKSDKAKPAGDAGSRDQSTSDSSKQTPKKPAR